VQNVAIPHNFTEAAPLVFQLRQIVSCIDVAGVAIQDFDPSTI
jgi:hypothetical protein